MMILMTLIAEDITFTFSLTSKVLVVFLNVQ